MWCPAPQCLGCASAGHTQAGAHARGPLTPEPYAAGGPGPPMVSHSLRGLNCWREGSSGTSSCPERPTRPGPTLLLGAAGSARPPPTPQPPPHPPTPRLQALKGAQWPNPQRGPGLRWKAGRGEEEPHVFVVHGRQHSLADGCGIGMEPREGEQLSGPASEGLAGCRRPGVQKLLT